LIQARVPETTCVPAAAAPAVATTPPIPATILGGRLRLGGRNVTTVV
jgi:hypothetical protein